MHSDTCKIELDNCTQIKIVLMFLVVLYHCCVFWTGYWFTKNPAIDSVLLSIFSKWLNTFHIYCFFMISGYLFFYGKYEKNKYNVCLSFVLAKVKRLIFPYITVSVFWAIPHSIYYNNYDVNDIIFKFLLGSSPNQLWFLLALFWIQLSGYFIGNIWKKYKTCILVCSFAIYIFGVYLEGHFIDYFQFFASMRCFVFYILGWCVREYTTKNNKAFFNAVNLWLLVLLEMLSFAIVISTNRWGLPSAVVIIVEFVNRVLGTVMAFCALQHLFIKFNVKSKAFYKNISGKTMTIYLFHQQLIYVTISIFNGRVNPFVNVVINLIFALTVSYVLSSVLLKYHFTSIMLGEKSKK